MERLTKKSESEIVWFIDHENDDMRLEPCEMNSHHSRLAIEKLAAYEDAEEQGLLLRLPLKIGDTVYSVTRDFISEYTICSIEKYNEGLFFNWRCEKGIYINARGFTNYQIGKDVFLAQAEAEEKLKEMKQ